MPDFLEHTRTLTDLLRGPQRGPEQLRRFQDRRVRQIVAHAYDRVPFYRKLYDAHGVRPTDIRGVEDLWRLPVAERGDMQGVPLSHRVARGARLERLIVRTTSGSSGRPFAVRRTWLEERTLGLLRMRAMHEIGYRPTDRHARVVLNRSAQRNDVQLPLRLLNSIGLLRAETIDCLDDPRRILEQLVHFGPDVITGFPGVLARVAVLAAERGPWPKRPRLVTTGGEVITPLMRRQIEEGFGAPLMDTYGSHEFNLIAWQCGQTGGMHTCDDGLVVEVLAGGKPVPPGGTGELVATNLHSFAMPFIRYRLGDVVKRGEARCPCGSPFGTIGAVQGRMIDYFPLPDGRLLHPWELTNHAVCNPAIVREYQLTQEHETRVVLRLVPARAMTPGEVEEIRVAARECLGPAVEFDLRLVDHIAGEGNGKFRVARSLVRSNYDAATPAAR